MGEGGGEGGEGREGRKGGLGIRNGVWVGVVVR